MYTAAFGGTAEGGSAWGCTASGQRPLLRQECLLLGLSDLVCAIIALDLRVLLLLLQVQWLLIAALLTALRLKLGPIQHFGPGLDLRLVGWLQGVGCRGWVALFWLIWTGKTDGCLNLRFVCRSEDCVALSDPLRVHVSQLVFHDIFAEFI